MSDVVKLAECPNCGEDQTVITSNKYEKKKECRECGKVRDLEIKDGGKRPRF